MISTANDFDTAAEYVSQRLTPVKVNIGQLMSTEVYNTGWQEIENQIGKLYEKTRILEDMHDYISDRIIEAIQTRSEKLADQLRVIESGVEDYANRGWVTEDISFLNSVSNIADRDGQLIGTLENVHGHLVMPGSVLGTQSVKSIMSASQQMSAELFEEDVLKDLSTQPFRSIHESWQPVEGGLQCTYEIQFSPLVWCNYIDLAPINCEITACKIISFAGDYIDIDLGNLYQKGLNAEIATIVVTVVCKNYDLLELGYCATSTGDSFDQSLTGRETL